MDYKLTLWGERFESSLNESNIITNEWKVEYCICTIASSTLTSSASAYNLQLSEKVNGERTLSFNMPYQYYDIDEQAYITNPYLSLLVNERIVKLDYNDKVYSFVITEITKSSDKKELSVSCANTITRELGKNGYSIILDTELENNMGNATSLAEYIMEDTDWHVIGTTNYTTKNGNIIKSSIIHSYLNEPLYWYQLPSSIRVVDMLGEASPQTIPAGAMVYISAYSYENLVSRPQMYWRSDGQYITNEDSVITNSTNWQPAEGVTWTWPQTQLYISASYRGKSLVNKATTKYCPKIGEYCTTYQKLNGTTYDTYYGFNQVEYLSNANIIKLIYNNISMGSSDGWTGNIKSILSSTTAGNAKYGLRFFGEEGDKEAFYSLTSSIAAFADSGITPSEEYIIAFHITDGNIANISNIYLQGRNPNTENPQFITYATATNLATGETCPDLTNNWLVKKFVFTEQIPYNELVEYALRLRVLGTNIATFDDIKMFKKVVDEDNRIIVPDLTVIDESVVRSKTYLFKESDYNKSTVTSLGDLKFNIINTDELEANGFNIVYNNDYELITSITASQSNRFNLIQDICEKFECWSDYVVETNSQGRINYYYKLTTDDLYKSGKQYYVQLNGATSEQLFDDVHYNYITKGDYFTHQTASSIYYYSGKDYYYYLDNGEFLSANLGYQWGQKDSASSSSITTFYIVSSYTSEGDPVYEVAETYNATTSYYIKDATSKYVMVDVGNEFATTPGNYYLFTGFNNSVYEKYYEKFLLFHDYTGDNNYAGFKYGINLNNITRKLDSSDIATKVIVANNSNQYADGSMCSIVDASQNSTHSNVLYDFNYYTNRNLIDKDVLNRDLYGDANGGLAYLSTYAKWNQDNLALTTEYAQVQNAYAKAYSNQTGCEQKITAAQENYDNTIDSLTKRCGLTDSEARNITYTSVSDDKDTLKELVKERDEYTAVITEQTSYLAPFRNEAKRLKLRLNQINQSLQNDTTRKKALDKEFYSRYGRFIQEGTWSSEDYIDPDLYYYDACRVLHTSAYPQVSYTINVADVSNTVEYPEYTFKIGDITYIRDTEFFADQGVELQNKFQVIVSEINRTLDDPTKNTITVVNYLTKFEDLFQRVAAATQALQYNEGKYNNAATAVDGEVIESELLARSLAENDAIISNSGSQEVTWDENGITVNDSNLANKLRIVGNGIVLSNDAGKTWRTGISSEGINADAITTGTLDVNKINLYSGSEKKFSWGKYGINAYTAGTGSSLDSFVRFDNQGIYGLKGTRFDSELTEQQIHDSAIFALTWNKGLSLKSTTTGSGYLKLSASGLGSVAGHGNKIIAAGISSTDKFYVTDEGYLYAQDVKVVGDVDAYSVRINGTAIMSSGKIDNQYLDLGGITIDGGTNPKITIKASSEGSTGIEITNSSITFTGYTPPETDITQQMASNYHITKTNLTYSKIESPVIAGNTIQVNGGSFLVKDSNGSATYGWLGKATGSAGIIPTSGEEITTYGTAICAGLGENDVIDRNTTKPYVITTYLNPSGTEYGGVRMSAGGADLFITMNGVIYYKQGGGTATQLGVAVFG